MGLYDAVVTQLKQVYQRALFGQESLEARFQFMDLGDGLRMEERVVGLNIGCGNEFQDADRFIVQPSRQRPVRCLLRLARSPIKMSKSNPMNGRKTGGHSG